MSELNANSVDPDQMLHTAASDLDLHRLAMSLLWDARHTWVKGTQQTLYISHCFFFFLQRRQMLSSGVRIVPNNQS